MKGFVIVLSLLLVGVVITVQIVKGISLKQNCTGYLKRAADANTVETAKQELGRAIKYLEDNNLTSGYTSVLWKTPSEDIEFWYSNLKASELELAKVDSSTSAMEKSNLLMKLRETLLDNGEKGDNLTVPNGLSRYPNNALFRILNWLLVVSIIIGMAYAAYDEV